MATYGSYISQQRAEELAFSYGSRQDLTFESTGKQINLWNPGAGENGRGEFTEGGSFDLALLASAYPEYYDTAQLSRGMVISSLDTVASDPYQANVGALSSKQNADMTANLWSNMFGIFFPDLEKGAADQAANSIMSESNRELERQQQAGLLGLTPSFADTASPGVDNAFYKELGDYHTYYGMAEREVTGRGRANTSWERYLNKSAPDAINQEQRNTEIVSKLRDIGFGPATRLTDEQLQDQEAIASVLEAAKSERTLDRDQLARFDVAGPGLDDARNEAQEAGLDPNGLLYRQYIYEEAQRKASVLLTSVVNGRKGATREEQRVQLSLITNLAHTVGPDFVSEALLRVKDYTNPNYFEEAWDTLPEGTRRVLISAGHSKETFARDSSGEPLPQISNTYVYQEQAKNEALKISSTEAREMIFEKGFHDGYANWTRRFSDVMKVDIGEDPFAMYFLAGTVPAGVGAGLYFGSGVAAGSAASTMGRLSLFSAIDGGLAGVAEGYIAGTAGQLSSIRSGARYELDFSGVHQQALLYGTMGAVGGGLLSTLPGGIGYGLRGTAKASQAVQNAADNVASRGVFGADSAERALTKIAEREATVQQLDGARMYDNIENAGLTIRLNAEEVSAKDVLSEVIPNLVQRTDGEEPSVNVDRIFDADELQRNGVSSADAVDLVYGIQRRLGPGEKLSAKEFDEIVTAFFAAAREHADEFKINRAGGADARVDLIDNVTKRKFEDSRRNFVGGNGGKDLSPKEGSEVKALIAKLGEGKATAKQVKKLAAMALRMSDERSMRRVLRLIEETSYFTPEEKLEFKLKMEGILERGIKAREDGFLQRIFNVEGGLSLLRNERSIRIVQELGVSPTKLSKYIQKYKRVVGDKQAIAELDREMPDVRKAIEAIDNNEGLEIIPDSKASFNVNKWLDESEATENIRDFMEIRKKLSRRVSKATKEAGQISDDKLDKALKAKLEKTTKAYRKALAALGREVDQDEAYALMLENAAKTMKWSKRTNAEKTAIVSAAIDRLMYKVSPDQAKIGTAREDGWWMGNLLKDTNLGRKLAEKMANIAMWPQAQQKLFRSRNRAVRGLSNWITGQHVSARVYGNSTDFMSIEAIVEGAAREVVPYVQMHKQLNRKLGSAVYRLFDREFLKLRQMAKLSGKFGVEVLEDISPDLRRAYKNFGGDEALLADLQSSQSFYTGLMTRSLQEMEEAGIGTSGISAARYIPNHIRGNLSAEKADGFVADFVKLRQNQLLADDRALDLDVLESIGWIKVQREDTASGKGLVKDYTIPEDSPFYVSTKADVNKKVAKDFIKSGMRGLRNADAGETGVEATASAGRVGSLKEVVEKQANLVETRNRVEAVVGDDPLKPAAVDSDVASRAQTAASAVAGTDEVMNTLERSLNEVMTATRATREMYEAETGDSVDNLIKRIRDAVLARRSFLQQDTMNLVAGSDPRRLRRSKPMSSNQKIKLVNDLEAYGELSAGHRHLLSRLDNLIAEGMMDDASARVVMLAYVDVDPSIMAGMSFARMDVTDGTYVGMANSQSGGTLIQLRRIAELSDDGNDAVNVAATMVHEVGHLAFNSAPYRVQAAIQSLLEQARQGDNEITELFAKFGIDINYATANVHEFAAHLAEIALVRNQTSMAKRGPMGEFLAQFAQFFKKLFGDIGILSKESEGVAEQLLGKEKWGAIRSAMKSMHDSFPEDSSADRILRAFDIDLAEEIDPFELVKASKGQVSEINMIKQAQQMNELKRVARQEEMDKLLLEDDPDANMMQNIFQELTELEEEAVNLNRSLAKAEQKQMDAPAPKVEAEAPKVKAEAPKKSKGNLKTSTTLRQTGLTLAEAGGRKEAPKGELTPAQQKDAALKKAAETKAAKVLREALADKDSNNGQIRTALMGMAYEDLTPQLKRSRPKERMGAIIADEKIMNAAVEIAREKGVKEAKSYILQKAKNLTDAELDTGSQKGVKLQREGRLTSTGTKDNGTIDLEAKSIKEGLAEAQEEVDSRSALLSSVRLDRDSLTPEQAKKVQDALINSAYRKVLLELMRDKPEIFGSMKLDEGTGFFKPSFAGGIDKAMDELEPRLLEVLKDLGADDITQVKTIIKQAFQANGIIGKSKSLDEDEFLNDILKQQAFKNAEALRRAETQSTAEAASETPIVREVQSAVAKGDLPEAKAKAEAALEKIDAAEEAKAEAPAPKPLKTSKTFVNEEGKTMYKSSAQMDKENGVLIAERIRDKELPPKASAKAREEAVDLEVREAAGDGEFMTLMAYRGHSDDYIRDIMKAIQELEAEGSWKSVPPARKPEAPAPKTTEAGDGTPPKFKSVKDMSEEEIFDEIGELEEFGVEGLLINEMAARYNEIRNELADRYGKPRPEPVTGSGSGGGGGGKPPKAEAAPRLKGGDSDDFKRPSDRDLRSRYEEDALERLDAETETDEELFGPMAGGAGSGDPPVILPRAPGGAPDDDFGLTPKKAAKIRAKVKEYLEGVAGRAETKLPRAGSTNAEHRLADKGNLEQIYTRAVNGDLSLTTEAFRKNAAMRGYENQSALQIVGKEYLHHAGGRFKAHTSGSSAGNLDGQIDSLGNVSSLHERTFTEADLDAEGGDKLADLFADAGSSVEGLMHYSNTTLGSIRIQKGVNELLGVKGGSMKEIFDVVETSMRTNMKTTANGRGRTLGDVEVDEQVTKYMEALKKIYIRSRGFNPVQDDGMKQSSRIAMNLAYSILGAKFAMSVLFVETPLALLRTSGLNPIKLAANTAELGGAYMRAAKGAAVQFPPLEKFMSALGVDTKLVKETVEDLSHSISNLRSNSMSRFGADGAGGMDQLGILFSAGERTRGHGSNILGAFAGRNRGEDAGFGQKLLDGMEAFSGATADLTGMLSFMHPVTNAIREVSSNQAKGTLLKHSQKLIQLSELMRGKDVTDTELIGMARQLGIPQTLAVYAAESGLLRPGMVERMIRLTGATSTTPGRDLNLSKLTEVLDGQRAARRESAVNPRFFAEGDALAEKTDDEMITSLNQFIAFFTNEMSPELRGTMKFSGENPLKDLLFQMLSYPIAAHQALVQNGMTARGPAMTAGILSSLVALEYLNRNLQTILHGKDEEAREEAMARLSRIPTQEDIVGALAMYGTSSPMFGAVGNYMRDLVGNPALRMYGHPDRNFPANPYSGPAISMMKRAYGTISKAAGNIGTAARTGDGEGFRGALGELGGLAKDISPLNAMAGGTGIKSAINGANFLFGGSSYGEGLKQAVVTAQTAGTHQTPGLVNPSVADAMAISFSPHNDDSPGSPGEIRQLGPAPATAQPQAPAQPAASPAPAESKPAPEISRKPGTGLVDLLQRRK